ncbi:MAG TPA: zeta toxin family protein [Vicinamibacteria bacterium]|jgi:predicted ABC-type ATPase
MPDELAELAELLGLSDAPSPLLIMVAGSNGAGKSTFYHVYLESLELPFINADLIAGELGSGSRAVPRSLSGLSLDQAAQRIADEERLASIVLRRSFVTETVLSDPVGAKVAMLNDARGRGYEVWLFFIGISSPELSRARVQERARSRGGHDVPADKIESRYSRTLVNLPGAIEAASIAVLLDNDLVEAPYRFVALFKRGSLVRASDLRPEWAKAVLH